MQPPSDINHVPVVKVPRIVLEKLIDNIDQLLEELDTIDRGSQKTFRLGRELQGYLDELVDDLYREEF